MSSEERAIVVETARSGFRLLCACTFFLTCMMLWVGTP